MNSFMDERDLKQRHGGAHDATMVDNHQSSVNLQAFFNHPSPSSSRPGSVDTEVWYEDLTQRAMSAPPVMRETEPSIFGFNSRFSHLFGGVGDIRCEPGYEQFYMSHRDQRKLPPPLERTPALFGPWESTSTALHQHPHRRQQQHPNIHHHHFHSQPPQEHYHLRHQSHHQMEYRHPSSHPPTESFSPPTPQMYSGSVNNGPAAVGEYAMHHPHYPALKLHQQATQNLRQQYQHSNGSISNAGGYVENDQLAFSKFQKMNLRDDLDTAYKAVEKTAAAVLSGPDSPAPNWHDGYNTQSFQNIPPQPLNDGQDDSAASFTAPAAATPVSPPPPPRARSRNNHDESPLRESPPNKRGSQHKYSSLEEAKGNIYSLAKDQYGCRFLQKKLEEANPQDIAIIFEEIFEHIVELMTDPFGNYLCQKLVEHCNDKQKTIIISTVSSALVRISTNMHGTRAVQKLVECLKTPKQVQHIISAIGDAVVPLIKDLNGNHVIQRCLQRMSYKDKQFIYNAVAGRCVEVATHKHGCCVLQRCIDYASPEQKMLLVREITANALGLVQNAFGNYVVQYILDLGDDDINTGVITKFLGHLRQLATNKFSSNVIEKCLRICNVKIKNIMVGELFEENTLVSVLQDSYGNYVIQTALSICDNKQFTVANEIIRPLLPHIRNTPFGKKVENRLNKRMMGRTKGPRSNAPRGGGGGGNSGMY